MKDDWWFKFQYRKWDDPELRLCTFEAQGFWLRLYIHLRRQGVSSITATVEDLARITGGTTREVRRSILNLQEHRAADVTLCNAQNVTSNSRVTLTSRSLIKELSAKEKTKLRVQRYREKTDVTPVKHDRVKSKKKDIREEIEEKKEKEVAAIAANPQEQIWVAGRELLKRSGEKDPGAILGKMVKDFGKPNVAEAVAVTLAQNPAGPKAYLFKVLRSKKNGSGQYIGQDVEGPEVEYKCSTCSDQGTTLTADPDAEFGWTVNPCPDCSKEAVAA